MATPTFQPIQQPHTWMHNPDYNVKEFSPSFRFSTITELMETLALVVIEEQQRQNSDNSGVECSNQTRDDCWKRIEYVLSMCPAMPPPGSTNTAAAAAATNGSAKYDQKLNVNGHGDELDQLSEDDDFTEYTMTNRRDVFVLVCEYHFFFLLIRMLSPLSVCVRACVCIQCSIKPIFATSPLRRRKRRRQYLRLAISFERREAVSLTSCFPL